MTYTGNLKFKILWRGGYMCMCFGINKLSLGNYSLKQNKINIYTNKTHCETSTLKVEPVSIKCALQNILDFS